MLGARERPLDRRADLPGVLPLELRDLPDAVGVQGAGRGARGQEGDAARGPRAREREMDLEDIVEKFNQMFGRIYAFLRGRIGDEVDRFMEAALERSP